MPRAFLVKKALQQNRWNSTGQDTENSDLLDVSGPHDLSIKPKKDLVEDARTPPPAVAMVGQTYNQQYDYPLEPLSPNVPAVLRTAVHRPSYSSYFTNFGGQVFYPLPSPYPIQGRSSPSLVSLSPPRDSFQLQPPDPLRLVQFDSGHNIYCSWSSDSPSPESDSTVEKAEDARFNCSTCDKNYSTHNGLSKHQQFHCSTHSKKSFNCKHCDKVYISLGALKMHIRTHTLPCKCKLCGKAFSRPWLLQGHIRTHTGEKPFSCSHCSRAFADRSNLRAHLQTHSDIKKYSCRMCTKTFSRMSLLTKHEESGGCLGTNHVSRSS